MVGTEQHWMSVFPTLFEAALSGDVRLFAAHVADSHRVEPYREHLPHPRSYWAYRVGDVASVGVPTNPADGEHVEEVLALAPDKAAEYLDAHDPLHADVVRLAQAMGLL